MLAAAGGRAPSDTSEQQGCAEWRWAQSRPWAQETVDDRDLAESIARYVAELRSAQTGGYVPRSAEEMISCGERRIPSPPGEPNWWQLETERRFEDLRPLQAKVLAMLGAVDDEGGPGTRAPEEIHSHLKTIAESETRGEMPGRSRCLWATTVTVAGSG